MLELRPNCPNCGGELLTRPRRPEEKQRPAAPDATTTATAAAFIAVSPRLPVADVEEALGFYCGALGFELAWKWGDPTSHASVCRNLVSLDLIATPPHRQGTAMTYVQVSGVDTYFAELGARGVVASDLANRDYGMRDFEVVDRWGDRIAFGQPTS